MASVDPFVPLLSASLSQTLTLAHELEAAFGEALAFRSFGDPEQGCNLIFLRLFRDHFPIRDTLIMLNVYGEHALMRFAFVETIGTLGDARVRLVEQISNCAHKAGLTFVFDEGIVYALSEEERALGRGLLPEAYRKKIEGLGLDWNQAQ